MKNLCKIHNYEKCMITKIYEKVSIMQYDYVKVLLCKIYANDNPVMHTMQTMQSKIVVNFYF